MTEAYSALGRNATFQGCARDDARIPHRRAPHPGARCLEEDFLVMAQLRSTRIRIAATTSVATAALLGGLTALPAQSAPAEGKGLTAGSPTAIKGSYIVTLKKGVGVKAVSSAGKGLINAYGGTVTKTFGAALNGYTANLSPAEAKRLAADPEVASVEQNQTVHLTDTTQSSAPGAWTASTRRRCPAPRSWRVTTPATPPPRRSPVPRWPLRTSGARPPSTSRATPPPPRRRSSLPW